MDPVGKKGRQFTQPSKSSRGEMACPVLANCQVLPAPLPIPGFRTSAAGLGNVNLFGTRIASNEKSEGLRGPTNVLKLKATCSSEESCEDP